MLAQGPRALSLLVLQLGSAITSLELQSCSAYTSGLGVSAYLCLAAEALGFPFICFFREVKQWLSAFPVSCPFTRLFKGALGCRVLTHSVTWNVFLNQRPYYTLLAWLPWCPRMTTWCPGDLAVGLVMGQEGSNPEALQTCCLTKFRKRGISDPQT